MDQVFPDNSRDRFGGFEPLLERFRPLTMVPQDGLVHLASLVDHVLIEGIPGDFVECGVWRGGASFLMAELLRQRGVADKKVWMFDSFEGLPPPRPIDGAAALAYARDTDSRVYLDNCRAGLEEVATSARLLGIEGYCRLVPGWFEETLPKADLAEISILRIDCDWYASVKCCLQNLYEQVTDGGFVIFDDYYTWDGCARAVHEFLDGRTERLEQHGAIAFFQKGIPFLHYQPNGFVLKNMPPSEPQIERLTAEYNRASAELERRAQESRLWQKSLVNDDLARQLAEHRIVLADRERQLAEHKVVLADRERQLAEHTVVLADRERQLDEYGSALAYHERQVTERKSPLIQLRQVARRIAGWLWGRRSR